VSPKNEQSKWTGGVMQAVERLLCKCEAPSSNPQSHKKKKKKKERKKEMEKIST
jgi:hypothetical protein